MTRAGAAAFAALLLVVPAPGRAQEEEVLDEGTLAIEIGSRPAGKETFRFVREASGKRVLSGRLVLSAPTRVEADYELRVGAESPWVESYATNELGKERLEVREVGRDLLIESGGASVAVAGWPGKGVVVDSNALAHFALLLSAYDREKGGVQEVPVLVPQLGGGMVVRVAPRPSSTELSRWFVAAPHHGVRLWTDSRGRLVRVENPAAGLSAAREGVSFSAPEPAPPAEILSREVKFPGGGGVELAGTVLEPRGSRGRAPGVILLSGAGPHDRRGNPARSLYRWDHLRELALALARAGYAVLAFDDRGAGASAGDFSRAGLSDLAADAVAAARFLATLPGVDPRRIAFAGHDEGGLVALLAAEGLRARAAEPPVSVPPAAVVLLATPSRPFAEIVLSRELAALAARGASERELGQYRAGRERALGQIRESSGDDIEIEDEDGEKKTLFVKYLRERLALDPPELAARCRAPILVLAGDQDVEIPSEDTLRFQEALQGAKHPNHVVRILEGLDHLLSPPEFGAADLCDEGRELGPECARAVAEWLAVVLSR
ncbi:MAG: alpha/beta hydrolase [Planctomycetes bacterium]|nr:alpha/beta hydrolase [Planctomycetota bacterium]